MCACCTNTLDIPLRFFSDSIFLSNFLGPEKERMRTKTSDFTRMFYEVIKLSFTSRPFPAPTFDHLQFAKPFSYTASDQNWSQGRAGNEATSTHHGNLIPPNNNTKVAVHSVPYHLTHRVSNTRWPHVTNSFRLTKVDLPQKILLHLPRW